MTNFDLKTLGLADGDYEITVVAKADGYLPSQPSNAVSYSVESNLINFYIGTITNPSVIYHAEPNMTWEQWVNSSYNTVGFNIVNGTVYNSDGSYYIDSVSATDTISNGASYYLFATQQEETYTIPAGTYVFDDNPLTETGIEYEANINFISNGEQFSYMSFNEVSVLYNDNPVYEDGKGNWAYENIAYQTVTIETDQIVSKDFGIHFMANTFSERVYTIPQGLYILDDEIDLVSLIPKGASAIGCTIDFNSNNAKYTRLGIRYNSTDNRYELCFNYELQSSITACYSSSGGLYWNNNAYKTLILQTDQYVNSYIYKLLTEHARKDELYGLWLFNPYLTYQSLDTINMNFQSNGQSYSSIRAEYNGDGLYLYFDNTLVCTTDQDLESGSWIKKDYQYIYVTNQLSEVTNGSTLLAWLNNTSKQINDPLNGNWYLRIEFDYAGANGTYAVNYESGEIKYTQIRFSSIIDDTTPTGNRQTLKYGNTTIINNGVWVDSKYQKIYITDIISAVENGFSLLSTLQQGITGYNADLVNGLLRTNGDYASSSKILSSLVLFFDSASHNKVEMYDRFYTKYRNVVRVQLDASGKASTIIPYQINNIVDYLENQGTGNPSETLALTSDIIIDTASYGSDCVTADTLVTMADGTSKAIGDIDVGEYILSYDWETMKLVPNKVIYSSKNDTNKTWTAHRYFKRTFSDGTVIKNAFAHRFYNLEDKMFKHLDFWQEGEHGYKFDGSFPHLVKVEKVYETCKYARITGELGTNFFANGLLTGDSECPQNIDLSQIVNKE